MASTMSVLSAPIPSQAADSTQPHLPARLGSVVLDGSQYSGHSLRAGLATSAAKAGKSDRRIMEQGRWGSRAMVDRYVREARLLDEQNAATGIGL